MGRNITRAAIVAGTCALGLVLATPAQAATTQSVVYHDNGAAAGQVWFNSGTHNTSKGRNSFTVKDLLCGDGWGVYVYWSAPATTGWSSTTSCGEFSFSVIGDVPRQQIAWQACRESLSDYRITCGPVTHDYLD